MAKICIQEHNDLNRALTKVPTFQAGMSSFSAMANTYFEMFALHNKEVPEFVKIGFELIFYKASLQENLMEYFDDQPPFQLEKSILSGSWSEGLFLYDPDTFDPPDVDFLCTLKNISFTEEDQKCGNLSLKENSPFVNAYLADINLLQLWQPYLVEPPSHALKGKICQLSATKLKERLYENFSKGEKFFSITCEQCDPITDSPALKLSRMSRNFFEDVVEYIWRSSDIVLAIGCEGWPQNALEWVYRQRNWPSKDVIESVTKAGFHIVGKSSSEGNFRLSFSVAEGILIGHWNKIQKKLMRAFKAVIKFLIPRNPYNEEILCSYHLKTIGFWHFERSTDETWIKENMVNHLLQMLKELVEVLRAKNLPMYFLRKYNLFSRIENLSDLGKLADKVETISRDLPGLTKAVRMGASFHFYENYRDYFKGAMPQFWE